MEFRLLKHRWIVYGNWTWRHPDGRIGKDVVVCRDRQEACHIMERMRQDHTKYVSYQFIHEKKDVPYFSPKKYKVTWRKAEDCPHWLR